MASGIIETVEEIASALGIAVVGAILTNRFAAGLTGLPTPITSKASTPADAIANAHRIDPAHITQVTAAFTHAMNTGLWVAAAVAVAGAMAAVAQPAHRQGAQVPRK